MDGHSLNDSTTLYGPLVRPSSPNNHRTTTSPAPPSLIILCTWQGGATPRRIARYITGYQALYPTSAILLLRTELADMTYRTQRTLRARLTPARELITAHLQARRDPTLPVPTTPARPSSPAVLLLHFFSHGGATTALTLLASLPPPVLTAFQSALRLVVSDSCPGSGTFTESYRAGLASLGPSPSRIHTTALAATVAAVYAAHGLGWISSVPGLRSALLDPGVFGAAARRLYFASEGDQVFPAAEVALHAGEARSRGYGVGLVRFERAGHCALVVEDEGRYWGAVREGWAEGRKRVGSGTLARL